MKLRALLLMPFSLLCLGSSTAQQNPDSKQETLALVARLKTMSQVQFQELLMKAREGDAAAQYETGLAYEMGAHVPKDLGEAARWWLKSAEQGYASAEGAYGMWVRSSNSTVAEYWMLRAAEHGDVATQFWLGVAYDQDWFGTTDSESALNWYRKAADGGDPDAQVVLGQKYADGEGVEQNYGLAAKWFQRAAEHFPNLGGAGVGRDQLGLLFMEGLGVPRDYAQAYFWFSLNGPEGYAEDAKTHLSLEQTKSIDASVKEWKERHRVNREVAAALNIRD